MKPNIVIPLFLALLPSCSWIRPNNPEGPLQKTLQREGIVTFSPPSGNPAHPKDWNKYGPGAVLDVRNGVSRGIFHSSANTFWGDDGDAVTQAMSSDQHSALHFPGKIELKRGADGSFGGTMVAQQAANIAADAGFQNATKVQVVLTGVTRSQPFSTDVMSKQRTKKLPHDRACVLAPVFAQDISYTFESALSRGALGSLTVPATAQAKLQAKGYSVTNSTLVSTGPVFLGFYPLP